MANIAHILLAATDAIDTATQAEMMDAIRTIHHLRDANAIDVWNADLAIQMVENEIEIRNANCIEDGESYDAPEVYDAIRAYRVGDAA